MGTPSFIAKKLSKLKPRKYDYVFSIGEACFATSSLARAGLRNESNPFDWCIGGTFEDRIALICNQFKDYINKEDLEHIGERAYPEPCTIYRNKRNDIVFNHDFPLDKTLDESYDFVKKKYQRRINRLLKKTNDGKQVLAVYMEHSTPKGGMKSYDSLVEASQKLNDEFPSTQVNILYIQHCETMKNKELSYHLLSDTITVAKTNITKDSDQENAVNKKNIALALSYIRQKKQMINILKRRFFYFPSRGEKKYVRIFGIKIKLNGKR